MADFAALILTHGRPDNVVTYKTLKKCGYTGPVFVVIDNEDKTAGRYRELFGDQVVQFDKAAMAQRFDEADNFHDRRSIVYARNASFDVARELGFRYFIQLDDDYPDFSFAFDDRWMYRQTRIKNLDEVWGLMFEFMRASGATSIAMAQRGDFLGGKNAAQVHRRYLKRKAMNSFFCDTENRFWFRGRVNEDVNTYVHGGSQGLLFFTVPLVTLNHNPTQSQGGGMTGLYLDGGTYRKSFYTVIFHPSSVDIRRMGETHQRLHHHVSWRNTVPCILHERHRK